MAALHLDFFGWSRAGVYGAVPGDALTDGRLTGQVDLTLRNQEPPNQTAIAQVRFDILGPGDVQGLKPGAVTHVMPAPGTPDFEETKVAYVELAAADLPWRYTPERAVGQRLRPWMVLVTAKTGGTEAQPNPGGTVTLAGAALASHDLSRSARWAHVQDDRDSPGRGRVARILSPRNLDPRTEYLAVLVPAFKADGSPSWGAGAATVTLPVFHVWRFTTSEEGDFPTLAARLTAAPADPTLGRAPLTYSPVPAAAELSVRGALAPIGAVDAVVPPEVSTDVGLLTQPVVDPRRPVIGLPNYGDAWVADPAATTWGATFHADPRHRAVGGLGLHAGILEQDLLSDAAAAQAGALAAAAQRIRHLVAGLASARALWGRRMPADKLRRLALVGPALRGMMTASGPVLDRIAGSDRPLPPALFSSAAKRILRAGPARSHGRPKGAADPAAVLTAANRCPPPPERAPKGMPHADDLSAVLGTPPLDDIIQEGVRSEKVPFERLRELYERFHRKGYEKDTLALFDQIVGGLVEAAERGQPVPVLGLLAILDPPHDRRPDDGELQELMRRLDAEPDVDSLLELGKTIRTRPPKRPCSPVDLDALADAVGLAVDPTGSRPFVVDRVLGTITGLDDQPLAPPELCPDLDIPAWQFLRDHDQDWLLPGAEQLPDDSVVAVETNPAFVDAFLLGVNTQTIGELRFRNIPIRTGCTPLRQFWARANPATNSYDDDIVGVVNWPAASGLGTTDHQTPAAASADLVIVFRTPLFRRYPRTVVYLTPAPLAGGQPNWAGPPDLANRLEPAFQGQITPEITFFGFDLDPPLGARHWVVLEEPPQGFQFFNATRTAQGGLIPGFDAARETRYNAAADGGNFAHEAFADPYRVLIRGDALIHVGP